MHVYVCVNFFVKVFQLPIYRLWFLTIFQL